MFLCVPFFAHKDQSKLSYDESSGPFKKRQQSAVYCALNQSVEIGMHVSY